MMLDETWQGETPAPPRFVKCALEGYSICIRFEFVFMNAHYPCHFVTICSVSKRYLRRIYLGSLGERAEFSSGPPNRASQSRSAHGKPARHVSFFSRRGENSGTRARALRERIGKQPADELVSTALRQWSRDLNRRTGEAKADGARERWDAIWADLHPRIGNDAESEKLSNDAGAREFNVTRYAYAEFFKGFGAPELSRFLVCDLDFDSAEVGAPQVELKRTQTIMYGAAYCDFRYRFKT
jgi:hypothetical protein